jgi:hypothetical protein
MRFLIYAIGIWIVFTVFTTVYAVSARREDVRTLPKPAWVAICLFVPLVGGILYLTIGRPLPTPDEYADQGRTVKTVAPDDDPDFLRRLSERLKKEAEADEEDEHGGDQPNV